MAPKLFTIAIAGNPNCGKTALFNALTGARQSVGNWPGVTVEKKEGFFELGNQHIRVVDLPGTYALFANAEDERAAVDYLLTREADLIVNIIDASNIEACRYADPDGDCGEHDRHRGKARLAFGFGYPR